MTDTLGGLSGITEASYRVNTSTGRYTSLDECAETMFTNNELFTFLAHCKSNTVLSLQMDTSNIHDGNSESMTLLTEIRNELQAVHREQGKKTDAILEVMLPEARSLSPLFSLTRV